MIKLASFGNFGLHVITNPAGTYSFVGTIPVELGAKRGMKSLKEACDIFYGWAYRNL